MFDIKQPPYHMYNSHTDGGAGVFRKEFDSVSDALFQYMDKFALKGEDNTAILPVEKFASTFKSPGTVSPEDVEKALNQRMKSEGSELRATVWYEEKYAQYYYSLEHVDRAGGEENLDILNI